MNRKFQVIGIFPVLCLLVSWAQAGLFKMEAVREHKLYSDYDIGNICGVSYNPTLKHIYISHGSDTRGAYIHSLDLNGNMINYWDFTVKYKLESYPGSISHPGSISYYAPSNHLFIIAEVTIPPRPDHALQRVMYETHLLEMSVDGEEIYMDKPITDKGYGEGLFVNTKGIWLCSFVNNTITHLSLAGEFIEQFPVSRFPDGFPGPYGLTAFFDDGFFVLDHFGSRIVALDENGFYIEEWDLSAKKLQQQSRDSNPELQQWDGRGMAIDFDLESRRIFVNDDDNLYILRVRYP